jgi:hypothetical protein
MNTARHGNKGDVWMTMLVTKPWRVTQRGEGERPLETCYRRRQSAAAQGSDDEGDRGSTIHVV